MFDTFVTIVGNALTTPEWRRVQSNQSLVANFKVAANSRRYDKATGRWVDGASLRVRVSCWRRLAENVAASVLAGDPVIVTGRLYSRDWQAEDGQHRVSYELDAVSVGHDLARGRGKFTRQRPTAATSTVDDEAGESRVRGEASVPVPHLNERSYQRVYDDELGGYVTSVESDGVERMLREAGLVDPGPADPGLVEPGAADPGSAADLRTAADLAASLAAGGTDGGVAGGTDGGVAGGTDDGEVDHEGGLGGGAGPAGAAGPEGGSEGRRRRRERVGAPA